MLALTGAAAAAHPNIAHADHIEVGAKHNGFSVADEVYLRRYEQAHRAGFDVGRNLLDSAWSEAKPVSEARIAASSERLGRWLNPPAAPEPAIDSTSNYDAPSVASQTSSGGYSIPDYIVQCESGGDYSAQNPSGAYGAYQIMPATAAGYGCDLSTPAGQDSCAARIYAAEGAAPWDCG